MRRESRYLDLSEGEVANLCAKPNRTKQQEKRITIAPRERKSLELQLNERAQIRRRKEQERRDFYFK